MALKNLLGRLKPRGAADGAKPTPTQQAEGDAAFHQRRADAIAKKAAEDKAKADAELKAARDETARVRLENELTAKLAARRFINPGDALALVRDQYEIRDGKLVSKASPEKDADAVLDEWAGARKHMIAASVAGGGAGAPASPQAPAAAAEPDLRTAQGATDYVRSLTHKAVEAQSPAAPKASQ